MGPHDTITRKKMREFCSKFEIFPMEVSSRRLDFFFNLISQRRDFIHKNQFLEILILVFIETRVNDLESFSGELSTQSDFVVNAFRDFLITLDYSGGWEKLQAESGLMFSRERFFPFQKASVDSQIVPY